MKILSIFDWHMCTLNKTQKVPHHLLRKTHKDLEILKETISKAEDSIST